MSGVKLHHTWLFTTPSSLPQQDCGRPKGRSRFRYDHHPAPPECIIQIQEIIKIIHTYIYLSNLRVKELEYNNS